MKGFVAAAAVIALSLAGCGTTVPLAARGETGTQSTSGLGQGDGTSDSGVEGGAVGSGSPASSTGSLPSTGGTAGSGGRAGTAAAPAATPGSGVDPGGRNSATSGAVPTEGRGWDATHVYIGVPTADDANAQFKSLGANFDSGSVRGDVDAIVADVNKSGGILGRQLVPVYHDASSADYASNASSTAQSMCSYFTQDKPVIAVINGSPQLDGLDSFHACLEHDGVTLVSFTNTDYSDKDYTRLGPHLFTAASLSADLIIPSFLQSLSRQQFFTAWDVRTGGPSASKAMVGILEPDNAQGHHVDALLKAGLRQLGVPVASEFFYDPGGSGGKSQSEVLQFQSDGVTHVLDLPPIEAEVLQFQLAAEAQHYRPRYGITSFDLPLSVQENASIVPPAQQVGSLGIGWQPFNDVDAAHEPGGESGLKHCLSVLAIGHQTFSSSQRRSALIGVLFCDAIYLVRDASVAGHGFDGSALLAGAAAAGPHLATAATFHSALSQTDHGFPGSYRDLQYQAGCSCFNYSGANRRFTR